MPSTDFSWGFELAPRSRNRSLQQARSSKEDEFYTQLTDIERELKHYKHHFRNAVVYCNCDDPRVSNFFHFFSFNFERLGLKRLITTCYKNQHVDLFSTNDSESAIYLEYCGDKNGSNMPELDEIGIRSLNGDGDFRSEESIELLKQADVVVTNPPFSLFREYVSQLVDHSKKFVIVAGQNAITTKEIFSLVKENKVWLGYNSGDMEFRVPDYYEPRETRYREDSEGRKWRSLGNACWLTNLDISKRHEDLILYKEYTPEEYPRYDNYDAIEVPQTKLIPMDYDGVMGVPVTFLNKHNPSQFEIVGITKTWFGAATKVYPAQTQVSANGARTTVSKLNDGATLKVEKPPRGKTYYMVGDEYFVQLYPRILIRRRR